MATLFQLWMLQEIVHCATSNSHVCRVQNLRCSRSVDKLAISKMKVWLIYKLKQQLSTRDILLVWARLSGCKLIDLCSALQLCLAFSLACISPNKLHQLWHQRRRRRDRRKKERNKTIKAMRVQKASYQSHAIKITRKCLAHKLCARHMLNAKRFIFPENFSALLCSFFDAIKSELKVFSRFYVRIKWRLLWFWCSSFFVTHVRATFSMLHNLYIQLFPFHFRHSEAFNSCECRCRWCAFMSKRW